MDNKTVKAVKAEDVLKTQSNFLNQFPDALVGFADIKSQGIIRLEVRVKTEDEKSEIPDEFEGYTVNTMVVTNDRYKQLKKYMTGISE